jgi:T5SS/PEP-CTERM-associated repeat protein/autotransporter-associated beta strand protein
MKPKFRKSPFGASLVTAIVVCLSGAAMAQTDNLWTGNVSSAWNVDGNWSLGIIPSKAANQNAVIDTNSPNIASITIGIIAPADIVVGANATGTLNHLTGDAFTGAGNWMFVGRNTGGDGTYNLANTAGLGGTLTGFGTGSGNMTVNNARLYVGGFTGAATGTCNVNTSGTLAIGSDLTVGSAGGTGVMNVDAGIITAGGWNFIGKNENGTGATGTFNMSGGSFTTGGRMYVGSPTCEGTLNLTGGSFTTGQFLAGGTTDGDGFLGTSADGLGQVTVSGADTVLTANGEFTLGNRGSTADMTFSSGTVNSTFWTQVGRNGGHGTLTMTGGTWNKTGGGDFVIGDFNSSTGTATLSENAVLTCNNTFRVASSGTGTLNISDNAFVSSGNEFWVGQGGGGDGTVNLSGSGSITSQNWVAIGREGGTGYVNMTGGTWTKNVSESNFIVGSGGPGVMDMSGGFVNVGKAGGDSLGITWIGELSGATGTLNLTGGEFVTERFVLGAGGGATGNLNLDGGIITTGHILGGDGTANVAFNGTQIHASAVSINFIQDLDTAEIESGGLLVDSSGFNLTAAQAFTGIGGIKKTGLGVLTLTGANSHAGDTEILDGGVILTTASLAGGAVTVADATSLGVMQTTMDQATTVSEITFNGFDNVLDFDLGNYPGNTLNAPLNVGGLMTVNSNVIVNVSDQYPALGAIPLISYASESVSVGFTLGTLPDGVDATISDNATGLVSLIVTRVNDPYWTGTVDNVWNKEPGGTANWTEDYAESSTTYADGDPVLFDDRVDAGPTTVLLNTTVAPGDSGVTFNNSEVNYNLTGTGKITGSTGLTKSGTGTTTLSTANDYTGVTTVSGGTLSVPTLTDGGLASPIGAADSFEENLVLNGGTLYYTGTSTTIDRGFIVTGSGGGIGTDDDLTISGSFFSTAGNFTKSGPGTLTLTSDFSNTLASGGISNVANGTLALSGTAGQSVSIGGELWVGGTPNVPAHLVLQDSSLATSSWIALGRGNGDTNVTSTITATDSSIQCTDLSTGHDGDLPTNDSNQVITLTNSDLVNNGRTALAERQNSITTMTLAGNSTFTSDFQFQMALNPTAECYVTIQDDAELTINSNWFSIGNDGKGELTVKNNGKLNAPGGGDFNVSDVGVSEGVLNIQDNAVVSAMGVVFVGKNGGTSGTVNMDGGTFNTNTYITIGRRDGATGVFNLNAGTINQTDVNAGIAIGEQGDGTLNVNGGSMNIDGGGLYLTTETTATGVALANLNGGIVTARRVTERDDLTGVSTLNLNGGLLRAHPDAFLDFMSKLDTANVMVGGAHIDSNGKTIAIAQPLLDGDSLGGGLTKIGAGFLQLNGVNTYTGTTSVTEGSLGGTGSIAGPLVIDAVATVAPGASVGTFTVNGNATIAGTYAAEIDGATADLLAVNGDLGITAGATLDVSQLSAPVGTEFVIATYTGNLNGTFDYVTGGTVDYSTSKEIRVTVVANSAFDSWAATNITAIDAEADATAGGDPENDGISNMLEFVLGGNPLASDPSILPDLAVTSTDFIFTFNRADESEAEVALTFQYGSDLSGWTDIAIGADTGSSGAGVVVDEGTPAEDPDIITVTVPRGVNTRLFGRLHAEK